jgi:ferritin
VNDALLRAFNDQITLEHASSYAYLQMAAWAEARDLTGSAAWFRSQSAEEVVHAHKFMDFVLDRDGGVTLQPIPAPRAEFADLVEVFEAALAHEQRVTRSIGELYGAAQAAGDFQSLPMLSWFLEEQVEEEASVRTILGELRMAAESSSALLLLDRELGARRGAQDEAG